MHFVYADCFLKIISIKINW